MIKKTVYWPKFFERKFILLTALFIMAQVCKWNGKIGDTAWLVASCIGVFGFVVIRLWFNNKGDNK